MYSELNLKTGKSELKYRLATLVLVSLMIPASCSNSKGTLSLDAVLNQLDDTTKCNSTLVLTNVHRLIEGTLRTKSDWPNFLEIAKILSDQSDPNVTLKKILNWRDKALLVEKPSEWPVQPKFYLQLLCDRNVTSWVPMLAFPTKKLNVYLILKPVLANLDVCELGECNLSKCIRRIHGGLAVSARECCSNDTSLCLQVRQKLQLSLVAINGLCAVVCISLMPFAVWMRLKPQELRSWALVEMLLLGSASLYSILLVDYFIHSSLVCWCAVWLRQLGFTMFYGSVTFKMYRIMQEYRVRKTPHIFVKEEDLLKFVAYVLGLTLTGLAVWTLATRSTEAKNGAWPQCAAQPWSLTWYAFELLMLLVGLRFCIRGRHSGGTEKWRLFAVFCIELSITLLMNLLRYLVRHTANNDVQLILVFLHLHLTTTPNIIILLAPKFIAHARKEKEGPQMPTGASARSHPSLAKLRDQLINGTVEFAEIPISEMHPEDIRAELKRVYTELRMYKLKNLYQDNPHISKGKGGKRKLEKAKIRRTSTPSSNSPNVSASKMRHIEEEEKSDPTVESAPHNVYLSTYKLQIEPQQSIRV